MAPLAGKALFFENTLPKNGTGATAPHAALEEQARGASGTAVEDNAEQETFEALEDMLMGRGGETMVMENELEHIVTRITDEGLVIELFELEEIHLFEDGTSEPKQLLRDLVAVIAELSKTVENKIAIGGHVRANPIVQTTNPVWDLSARRADRLRELLQEVGVPPARIQRVTGHADRDPALSNTMARRNNRLEVILLRESKRN